MLDIVRFYMYCLLITKVFFSITSATKFVNENINSTGKFSRIEPVFYSNLTDFDGNDISHFPRHAENLQIEYFGKNKIRLQWKIEKESLKSLKGFCLQMICNFGIRSHMNPENITLFPINNSLTDFDLILEISHGSSDIILHTLPYKNDCLSTIRRTVVMIMNERYSATALFQSTNHSDDGYAITETSESKIIPPKWTPPIITFKQEKDNLEVDFREPSKQINNFQMCLQDGNKTQQCRTFKKPPVNFEEITGGNYIVTLTSCDPSSDNKNCTQIDKYNCTHCKTIETSYITFKASCELRNLQEYLYPLFGGLFIGILALLLLLIAVKIHGLRYQNLEKKSILLLNTSDNIIHEKAVENFITCLENLNIIVHRPTLPFSKEKLQCLLSIVDNVVLLDSLALGRRQEAWADGKDYGQFLVEANSKELTKSLFTAINLHQKKENHFLRCKWRFVPDESEFKYYPTNSRTFIIPDQLQIFAEMIHQSSVDLRECKFSKSLLKQNIIEEIQFITQNPNWFTEKYGTAIITETEVEITEQPNHPRVLDNSELNSCVSSILQKINQDTDKELGVNMINLNNIEVLSV